MLRCEVVLIGFELRDRVLELTWLKRSEVGVERLAIAHQRPGPLGGAEGNKPLARNAL